MPSTLGGDDEAHDFSPAQKDKKEKELRKDGDELRRSGKSKKGQKRRTVR